MYVHDNDVCVVCMYVCTSMCVCMRECELYSCGGQSVESVHVVWRQCGMRGSVRGEHTKCMMCRCVSFVVAAESTVSVCRLERVASRLGSGAPAQCKFRLSGAQRQSLLQHQRRPETTGRGFTPPPGPVHTSSRAIGGVSTIPVAPLMWHDWNRAWRFDQSRRPPLELP